MNRRNFCKKATASIAGCLLGTEVIKAVQQSQEKTSPKWKHVVLPDGKRILYVDLPPGQSDQYIAAFRKAFAKAKPTYQLA